jgi:hypothetical protein
MNVPPLEEATAVIVPEFPEQMLIGVAETIGLG